MTNIKLLTLKNGKLKYKNKRMKKVINIKSKKF